MCQISCNLPPFLQNWEQVLTNFGLLGQGVDVHFSDIVLGLIIPHQAGKDGEVKGGKMDVTVTSVEEADAKKRKEQWKKEKEVLYLAGLLCSSLGFCFL